MQTADWWQRQHRKHLSAMTRRVTLFLAFSAFLLGACSDRSKTKAPRASAASTASAGAAAAAAAATAGTVATPVGIADASRLFGRPGKIQIDVQFRVRRHGQTRVMVAIQRKGSLQNSVAALRERLVKNPAYKGYHQLGRLPLVALAADEQTLAILDGAPEVARVVLDTAAAPATVSATVQSIHADELWPKNLEGVGAAVAVLDTGIDATHPFLRDRVAEQACFSLTDENHTSLCPNGGIEDHGPTAATPVDIGLAKHGTHVAGIAAGLDGEFGGECLLQGVARRTQIVAVQIFTQVNDSNDCGPGGLCTFASSQIAALDYLDLNRARLNLAAINLSISEDTQLSHVAACDDDDRKIPIDTLLGHGVATVIAAGNQLQRYGVSKPGCITTAFTVGGLSSDNYPILSAGQMVDLFAPGSCVVSSVTGGGYESMNGTSVAAPLVAGAIAALRSTPNPPTVAAIQEALLAGSSYVKDCRSDEDKKGLDLHGTLQALFGSPGARAPVGGVAMPPGSSGRPPATGSAVPGGGAGSAPPVGGIPAPLPRKSLNDCNVSPSSVCPAVCAPPALAAPSEIPARSD